MKVLQCLQGCCEVHEVIAKHFAKEDFPHQFTESLTANLWVKFPWNSTRSADYPPAKWTSHCSIAHVWTPWILKINGSTIGAARAVLHMDQSVKGFNSNAQWRVFQWTSNEANYCRADVLVTMMPHMYWESIDQSHIIDCLFAGLQSRPIWPTHPVDHASLDWDKLDKWCWERNFLHWRRDPGNTPIYSVCGPNGIQPSGRSQCIRQR